MQPQTTHHEDERRWATTVARHSVRTVAAALLVSLGLAATASTSVSALALPNPTGAARDLRAQAASPIREVGRFSRFPDVATAATWFPTYNLVRNDRRTSGIPHLNTVKRRMYQFYDLQKPGNNRIGILIRDLDTFEILSSFVLQPGIMPGGQTVTRLSPNDAKGELLHLFDHGRDRLVIATQVTGIDQQQFFLVIHEDQLEQRLGARAEELGSAAQKVSIGLQGGDVLGHSAMGPDGQIDLPELGDPRAVQIGQDLRGLTLADDRYYLVKGTEAQAQPEANYRLEVIQIDPDSYQFDWARVVRSCEGPSPEDTQLQFSGWVPVLKTADSLFVPCTISRNVAIVQVALESVADPSGAEVAFRGNGNPAGFLADPTGQRFHVRTKSTSQSILSFDVPHLAYVGQHAVTNPSQFQVIAVGIDRRTGRVYSLAHPNARLGGPLEAPEALALVDGRTTPIEPPKRFAYHQAANEAHRWPVLPRDEVGGALFIPTPEAPATQSIIVLEDDPPPTENGTRDLDANTRNVNERVGKTDAQKSTETSAYGLRTLIVRGFAGVVPGRFYDAGNSDDNVTDPQFDRCQADTRLMTFARVREVRLSGALQTAQATPLETDVGTVTDVERPSRCTVPPRPGRLLGLDPTLNQAQDLACVGASSTANAALDDLQGVAPWLPGLLDQFLPDEVDDHVIHPGEKPTDPSTIGAPEEPCQQARDEIDRRGARQWPFQVVSCSPGGPPVSSHPSTKVTDPKQVQDDPDAFVDDPERLAENPERVLLADFSATAECQSRTGASAAAAARPPTLDSVLAAAPPGTPPPPPAAADLPSVTVGHTSTGTSYRVDPTRGLVARAEALVRGIEIDIPAANGLPAVNIRIDGAYSLAESVAKGRPGTSGTVHRRILWGIHGSGGGQEFHRDLCGTEECLRQARDGLNRILGDRGRVRVPSAEPALAAGSPRGYTAAIQLETFEAINRSVVDGDSAKEIPVMDLVLFNDSLVAGKQRQIIQFAGVKTNSQYGIFCLGGGQVKGKECVLPAIEGGSITVSLTDDEGKPLPGAQFEASGPQQASCTTGADGRCNMIDVRPGSYTVTETRAPDGYVAAAPVSVQVVPKAAASATFVNFPGVASIEISLSDATTKAPLKGGVFQVTSGGAPFATCTTDDAGLCPLSHPGAKAPNQVPLGQYSVQQMTAPSGYQPVTDPVSVSLDQPGQIAKLPYTNGTGAVPPDADVEGGFVGPSTLTPIADNDDGGGNGVLGGLFDAFGDLGQWVRRNPGEALMFFASMALFASPFWASWRRRLLLGLPRRPGI